MRGIPVVLCLLAVSACGSGPDASAPPADATATTPTATQAPSEGPFTADYLPGLPATIRVPAAAGPAPLVVLVPGGGWASADPAGLQPLAEVLARQGATTVTITYSTTSMGAQFPQPVDDVACALRWSAARSADLGHSPSSVILIGHSAGGHLATLVALSGERFGGTCPWPRVEIDGVVGLAGVYDTTWAIGSLDRFFGGSTDPELLAEGSPLAWAQASEAIPSGLRVLLVHGDADGVVPLEQTRLLADALRGTQADVSVVVLEGQDHDTVYRADVAGPVITDWMGLP
jgi:acetyl esterase/lipase